MNIYTRLKQDYDKQRDLCEDIKNTRGDSERRNKLWKELRIELEAHA